MGHWGVRMLWRSFNLMHTQVLIQPSFSDCCYRAGCTLSPPQPSSPPAPPHWSQAGGCICPSHPTITHTHQYQAHTHTHQPTHPRTDMLPLTLSPCLARPPSLLHPSFFSPLFLSLTFPLMSCNTDNEPDDLPLIRLSLACLVIDP